MTRGAALGLAPISRVAAWALAALATSLAAGVVVLVALTPPGAGPEARGTSLLSAIATALFLIGSPVIGALIVSRARGNAVGWLFIVVGGALGFGLAADAYSEYAYFVQPGSLPYPAHVKWLGSILSVPAFAMLPNVFLLFPDGRPPTSRWWPVLGATFVGLALLMPTQAFTTRDVLPGIANPFALEGAARFVDVLEFVGAMTILASGILGAAALVRRFRRSRGIERQQLKWFVFAIAVVAPLFVLSNVRLWGIGEALQFAAFPSLVLLPLAAAVAIFRYRLYDIDLLINRTLVYGALSVALAATYFAAVALLQTALRPLTGESELAVAGSTLAVVALFAPLRRRIQAAVDRRFYRSRYDAARTLDAFGARLRDEVDLDAVRADLLDAVHDTVRPAHASVWLRGSRRPR